MRGLLFVSEMKQAIAFVLAVLLLLPASLAAQVKPAERQGRAVVFNHATIIDVAGGVSKSEMTVVISGHRIAAVGRSGKVKIPPAAEIIDASGKFLIPGLWEMHAHLGDEDFDKNFSLRLFIASGVTGIRLMDGDPAYFGWRREAEKGDWPAPRMLIASRVIGFGDLSNPSAANSREEVRRAKQAGADFIKVHDNLSRESYFALMDEAGRLNLPVAGHVPNSITASEASAAGQKSVEHFTGLDEATSDPQKAETLIAVFKKNHTWFCPTLIMRSNYASLDMPKLAEDWRLKYVKPSWTTRWLKMTAEAVKTPPEEWSERQATIRREKMLVGKMQRAQIGILAGTDVTNPFVIPGFSLHDELALLVEAGLTPAEALRAATINPAKFFDKTDSLGAIEKGKLADLVLLEENPLRDISNTKKIVAVIADGRYFSKEAIEKILSEVEAQAK